MPKYIDADNLKTILEERRDTATRLYGDLGGAVSGCIKLLDQQPAAAVEPVRHGRWIPINRSNPSWSQFGIAQHKCSECGSEETSARKRCPECGAKMDKEEGHE